MDKISNFLLFDIRKKIRDIRLETMNYVVNNFALTLEH